MVQKSFNSLLHSYYNYNRKEKTMNNYTIKTNQQLMSTVTSLVTSMKQFNQKTQQFLGDFIVSYGTTHNSTCFNLFMQALLTDKRYNKTRVQIIKWISETTNYKVKYNKDKGTYGIGFKQGSTVFEPLDTFYSTNFYDEEEQEKQAKEYTIDNFMKSLENLKKKAEENNIDWKQYIK